MVPNVYGGGCGGKEQQQAYIGAAFIPPSTLFGAASGTAMQNAVSTATTTTAVAAVDQYSDEEFGQHAQMNQDRAVARMASALGGGDASRAHTTLPEESTPLHSIPGGGVSVVAWKTAGLQRFCSWRPRTSTSTFR